MEKDTNSRYKNLTSTGLLAKNTLWSLSTRVLPLLVGLAALPYLISELGTEEFGLLAIIWLIMSYFSMFDLGMGRALVKKISDCIAESDYDGIRTVGWTGIIFISLMGVLAGLLLFISGELLLAKAFQVSNGIAATSISITAFSIPFIVSASSFKSILMAEQKFKAISIIDGFNSLMNYLLPLLLLYFFQAEFVHIIIAILGLKIMAFLIYCTCTLIIEPRLRDGIVFEVGRLKEMISFGKWVTVSNIVGPLMGQMDRYFIGAFISISAVTYFTTPLEVLGKVTIVPLAFITVLFPAFSNLSAKESVNREGLFLEALKSISVILFPVLLLFSAFSNLGLRYWLGSEFELNSTFIAQIFCLIFFLRGLSYVPSTYLHALNRPDLTAKFHLVEIIVFIIALLKVSKTGLINDIALVSLGITLLDTLLMFSACYILMERRKDLLFEILLPIVVGALLIVVQIFVSEWQWKVALLALSYGLFVWKYGSYTISMIDKFKPKAKPVSV